MYTIKGNDVKITCVCDITAWKTLLSWWLKNACLQFLIKMCLKWSAKCFLHLLKMHSSFPKSVCLHHPFLNHLTWYFFCNSSVRTGLRLSDWLIGGIDASCNKFTHDYTFLLVRLPVCDQELQKYTHILTYKKKHTFMHKNMYSIICIII